MEQICQFNDNNSGRCCWEECFEEGKFPAPKSPENRHERYLFCLKHIRQYNNSWDFFRTMDSRQINNFHKETLSGHRPTWKFGVNAPYNYSNMEEIRKQVFNEFRGAGRDNSKKINEYNSVNLAAPVRQALKTLGLTYPVSLENIKKKYKKLAKEYHPDINNCVNLEKIKHINQAYSYLKNLNLFN